MCEAAPGASPTGFQRLGRQPAITAVADDFVANVAADNRLNRYFSRTNIPHLKMELVDQICEATGGPCTYTRWPMGAVHAGMHITDADFKALVQDLVKSLNKFNVPPQEQQELLATLGPLKSDIVKCVISTCYTPQVSHSSVVAGQSPGGRLIAGGGVWPRLPG